MARISIDKKIDALSKKFDDMKKTAVKWEHNAEDHIKEHPVKSVSIAFGVGILAGAIIAALSRRR